MTGLEKLREKIDAADLRIKEAFCERMKIVRAIGEMKSDAAYPVYDQEREKKKIAALREEAHEGDALVELYQHISAISKKAQRSTRYDLSEVKTGVSALDRRNTDIVIPDDAACVEAALVMAPKSVCKVLDNADSVISAVASGESEYGVLPIKEDVLERLHSASLRGVKLHTSGKRNYLCFARHLERPAPAVSALYVIEMEKGGSLWDGIAGVESSGAEISGLKRIVAEKYLLVCTLTDPCLSPLEICSVMMAYGASAYCLYCGTAEVTL